MEYLFSIFSQLFFIGAVIPLYWGIYIIRLNPQQRINRVFLLLCISLSMWSFGFSMASSSETLEYALLWRRFGSIGMIVLFSAILHFLALLTHQGSQIKNKKRLYLIYFPALILVYIYTLSPQTTAILYDLIETDYGLINVASHSIWNYLYYTYYGLYMMISLVLILKWRNKIGDKAKKRQANLIFGTIVIAGGVGSLTDILSSVFFSNPIPQMAPLFILFPVWTMYHSIKRYDLIDDEKTVQKELVVTEIEKEKMFDGIALLFLIGGFIVFIFEYSLSLQETAYDLELGMLKSITVMLIGIIIYFAQKIQNTRSKEVITITMIVGSIPLITLSFTQYFAITMWAYPMIIIITSLVLSKKTLLISTTLVSIITQRLIWITNPEGTVYIDGYAYVVRMFFLFAAFLVGYYVNKMYMAKIKENEFQISFQRLNAEISSEFFTINTENKERKIASLLSKLGLFFEADRTYLFMFDEEKDKMIYTQDWSNEKNGLTLNKIDHAPMHKYPWWIEKLKENKLIYIADTKTMPREATNEQTRLLKQNIKTLVAVPVEGREGLSGFIGVDSIKVNKSWTTQNIELLKILANILSEALIRTGSQEQIEHMAYYDDLTQLPNRHLFKKRVREANKVAQKTEGSVSVMFIDMDNFKTVNNAIGHYGGDSLLKKIAKRLVTKVGEKATVARFGGDEFLIMVNDLKDKHAVEKMAKNIMNTFTEPFNISNEEFYITGSLGIAMYPVDGSDPEILVKNAVIAMSAAEFNGKNQYSFCTSGMKAKAEKQLQISNDLYHALERDELVVYYQPQLDIRKTEIIGLEALLRWKHPELGMIPPSIFIPLAEEHGLINNIGKWVLKTACAQNKKWQEMGLAHLRMAVNLSGIQLLNVNIVEQIEEILKETRLEPKYLELEITESIAIDETDYVIDVLNKLKQTGLSIAIDDFGTEYSSLSRLKLLPIDRIKIDMEFIHGIENNEKDKAITVIIINLAKSLGLDVLAEGVETAPQLEFLNQKLCDEVQGYYYYRPLPAEELEKELQGIRLLEA